MRTYRVLGLAFLLCSLLPALRVDAHPLGNFTINHLARVTAASGRLHVHYVLDIAEIPTFQIMHERSDGAWSDAIMAEWARNEAEFVRAGMRMYAHDGPLVLTPVGAQAALRPGAGGLPILRWTGEFVATLSDLPRQRIVISDGVYADRRIGWKDIVVGSQREPTNDLRAYPSALIGTPRRINGAALTLSTGSVISNVVESSDAQPVAGSVTYWVSPTILSSMFARPNQSVFFVLLTILAAFGLGALHAFEPGHGKALLAFTLVGARATSRQALILAGSLTFAHTIGVLLLGAVLFFASGFVSESIYPWITLVSGIVIAVIGARTLARFMRAGRGLNHLHEHVHEGAHPHTHAHDHDNSDGVASAHGHTHAIPGSQPLNFSNAIWAAMSGGIAPCPAAIVVMLAALRMHHLPYGMLLIVIFSFGLASVLSAIGLGVVRGAAWLSRRSGYVRVAPYAPLVSAMVISTIGAWMIAQGFVQQGVAAPALMIAALALAAIAGYAFTQSSHTHRAHKVQAA